MPQFYLVVCISLKLQFYRGTSSCRCWFASRATYTCEYACVYLHMCTYTHVWAYNDSQGECKL